MKFQFKWCVWALTLGACSLLAAPALRAQDREHVVSTQDLQKDVQKAAQTRQGNEAAVRELFRSDAAQNTLKSAHVDYQKVDKAVGQLSDEELVRCGVPPEMSPRSAAGGEQSSCLLGPDPRHRHRSGDSHAGLADSDLRRGLAPLPESRGGRRE